MRLVHPNGNEVEIIIDGAEVTRIYRCDLDEQGRDTHCYLDEDDARAHVRRYVQDLRSDGYRDTRGRPPVGRQITVRLPEDLIAALDAKAAEDGTSRPHVIRQLLTSTEHVTVDE
ncbi:MAG: CopG family transcriptional regulator [Microbispora sp.]|nr:CopG family transcriptional regulator [Microbispora sp.]